MRILITGHNGYIGSVLVQMAEAAGHEVIGLDSYLFERCTFGEEVPDIPSLRRDLRSVEAKDLRGFDAILHLAGLSSDPLGDLNPAVTFDINHRASVRLARLAKGVGVSRFIFSSSCSNYGSTGEDMVDESAAFKPVTPYGHSKVRVEQDVSPLADESFSPVFLRSATAYGVSTRLRGDLVLNNLVGYAFTTGEVLIKSDGTAWRPLVHIRDIALAFLAVLHAPRELVHNEAFNVGRSEENYRVRELAAIVAEVVPGSKVSFVKGASPDKRCYRVNCDKILRTLPEFEPTWTVRAGAQELFEAYERNHLSYEEFESSRYLRISHVQELMARGVLDRDLRLLKTRQEAR